MDGTLFGVAVLRLFNQNGKLCYLALYLFPFPVRIFVKTSTAQFNGTKTQFSHCHHAAKAVRGLHVCRDSFPS